MTGWCLCTAGNKTWQHYRGFCSRAEELQNSSLSLENFFENLIIKFMTSAFPRWAAVRRCGDAGPSSGPGSSEVPARAVRCHQQQGTWLCSCPAPTNPNQQGKGNPRAILVHFSKKKKWGYGKRCMPNVTALFLIAEHPYSSSRAFS